MCTGKHLLFIYTKTYQCVGDAKTPFLRVTNSKQRLKTGIVFEIKPTHLIVLSNSDCKKFYQILYNQFTLSFTLREDNWFLFRDKESYINHTIQNIFRLAWIPTMPVKKHHNPICPDTIDKEEEGSGP